MKFCTDHWSKLRAEIDRLGMSSLIAKSGEEAISRAATELKSGESTRTTFDPLMAAHNMIVSNVMERAGLDLFVANEDGTHKCPLCYANKRHSDECDVDGCDFSYDSWMTRAAEDVLAEAKRLGLVGEG